MKKYFFLFLFWKFFILAAAFFASRIIPLQTDSIARTVATGEPYLRWVFANFDGVHYITIARVGYWFPNFAFFPLYPILINIFYRVTQISHLQAAIFLSHFFLVVGVVYFYKIVRLDYKKEIADRAVFLLFAFPLSFFYGAVYTDSLYFFLATASFYYARKGSWKKAGIFGFFAGLSRLVGIVLFVSLCIEWLLQNKKKYASTKKLVKDFFKTAYGLLLIPCAIVLYGLYLQIGFGDFFLFSKSMVVWGQSDITFPLQTLYRYGKILLLSEYSLSYARAVFELTATIFYFYLTLKTIKVRLSYAVFVFLTLIIIPFTGTLWGMPRYALHIFPLFLTLALLLTNRKFLFRVVVVIFFLLQGVLVALFTRGYFVA